MVETPEACSSSEMVNPSSTVNGGHAWAQASKQVVSPAGSLVKAYSVWPLAPTITSPRLPTSASPTAGAAVSAAGAWAVAGSGAGAGAGAAAGAGASAGASGAAASPLIRVASAAWANQTPPTPCPLVSPGAPSPA